jgi:hypothetical protein
MTYLKEEAMKSPIDLLVSLVSKDYTRLLPDVKGLERDIITLKKRYENEGDGFLTIALPALCDALDRGLADGKFACPRGLSKVSGGTIPKLFSGMFCKVFDIETGRLLESDSVEYVLSLRQCLRLFKKLSLADDQADELDRKAKRGFFEDDLHCGQELKIPDRMAFILDSVCKHILPNIDSFDERELECKHGPGAVVEKLTPNKKYSALLTYSGRLEELGYDINYAREGLLDVNVDSSNLSRYGVSGDKAKLISVLKNSTSRRTITIEPVIRQFVQQGFNTLLRSSIERCSVLRRCLDLTDQSKNSRLALVGSQTGQWATIDLKSASDLLTIKLVETVFRHRPVFLAGLLDCRSPEVSADKSQITLQKFAGMGNATTFPVQSVVFAVLAISALLDGFTKFPSYRNIVRVARLVRVYGDDIIVPSEQAHQVEHWISHVGLKVNVKKTFAVGNFRESCGVDAFRGVDVTPLYVRLLPVPSKKEPNTLAHLVSLCNQAWLRCLYGLAEHLREIIEELLGKKLPLVSRESSVLGLHTRLDAQDFHRWNPKLHRAETKGTVLIPLKRSDEIDGYAALTKFFLVPLLGRAPDHLVKSPVRFRNGTRQRWVPAYTGSVWLPGQE